MVTGRDSNTRREGSIPSQPATGSFGTRRHETMGRWFNRRTIRSHRIDRGAIPRRSTHGIVAQTGERLDGIEEVAGAIPADSTAYASVSNAGEDYIRNYNGPKVAMVGGPT